jgi:SAM-dependent methyltransferase
MALYLPSIDSGSGSRKVLLDIAPTKGLSELMKQLAEVYVSLDFDPTADGREVNLRASLTALPLRSDSVDLIFCSHVLEHVPDDRAAIREIARTLRADSVAVVQVPRRVGTTTEEDPTAGPEERALRFGQPDHVRTYGDDLEQRLEQAGLRVVTLRYTSVLPPACLSVIGAQNDEEFWIVTKGKDPLSLIDPGSPIRRLAHALLYAVPPGTATNEAAELQKQLARAVSEAETWRSHYEWLRTRAVVKWAAAGRKVLRRMSPASKH